MKKLRFVILLSLGLVVIFTVAIFATKSILTKKFDKNVVSVTGDLFIAAYIAESVTNEYADIWKRSISSSGYIMVDGEQKYFNGFSEAVIYKKNKIEESGQLSRMDSILNVATINLKKIDGAIFGDKDVKKCVKDIYINVSEYCSLANSPSGSLMSFNEKRSELSSAISRTINELKLYMPEE